MKSLANSDVLAANHFSTCSSTSVPCIPESAYRCQSLETDGDTCSCCLPAPVPACAFDAWVVAACLWGSVVVVLLSLGPNLPFELGGLRGAVLSVGAQPWTLF